MIRINKIGMASEFWKDNSKILKQDLKFQKKITNFLEI